MKREPGLSLLPRTAAILCAAHLAFSLAYALAFPSFEKPDEPGHLDYIRFLSENHRLRRPLPDYPYAETAYEGHQGPLHYVINALLLCAIDSRKLADFETEVYNEHTMVSSYRASPEAGARRTLRANPRSHAFRGPEVNLFERDARDSFPYRYPYSVFRVMRLTGVLWGLLAVFVTYHISVLAFGPRSPWPTAACALVAFNPQFCFAASSVSNDGLAVFLAALLTYLGLKFAFNGRSSVGPLHAALAGLVLGLASLAKLNTLVLGLFILPCIAVGYRWRPRASVLAIGACLTAAIAIAGWYFIRNALLFGDPFALETAKLIKPYLVREAPLFSSYILSLRATSLIPIAFRSFWACFGWMNVRVDPLIMRFFLGLSLAGGAGIPAWLAFRPRPASARDPVRLSLVLLLLFHFALSLGFMIRFNMTFPQPQGRYLFPSLPAIGVLLAIGIRFWIDALALPGASLRTSAPAVIAAVLGTVNFLCLLEPLRRY